jgi:hypothetical protein
LLITPEHQQLKGKYQNLVLRSYQHESIVQGKDDIINELKAEIRPMKNLVEQLMETLKEERAEQEKLLEIIKQQNGKLQQLELIEHQYK